MQRKGNDSMYLLMKVSVVTNFSKRTIWVVNTLNLSLLSSNIEFYIISKIFII